MMAHAMECVIGTVLALVVIGATVGVGLGRERSFFPTVLIVIASYYVLFAAMAGAGRTVVLESILAAAFMLAAIIGFRTRLWFVVAALAGHGVMDAFHHRLIENPGVPMWWPGFCLSFDVTAAALLALLLVTRRRAVSIRAGSDR